MKKILYFLIIIVFPFSGFSQLPPVGTIDLEGKDFRTIDAMYANYYNDLKNSGEETQSIFGEGGSYNEWLNWRKKWSKRLPNGGSFDEYFDFQSAGAKYSTSTNKQTLTPWEELGPRDDQISSAIPFQEGWERRMSRGNNGPLEFITFFEAEDGDIDTPSHMLTGSTNGGLFYSDDSGENWVPAGSDTQWDVSGCTWATFKKNDPNVWFATSTSTGKNVRPENVGINSGAYRTTNKGQTWTPIVKVAPGQLTSYYTKMYKVLVLEGEDLSSDNDDILLLSTNKGLFRATYDVAGPINIYNKTNITYTRPDNTYEDFAGNLVYDIDERPGIPGSLELYATVKSNDQSVGWTVQKSEDGGESWDRLSNLSSLPPTKGIEFPPNMKDALWVTIEMSKADNEKLFCITTVR